MNVKKYFIGAAVLLMMFANSPQASADDVEIFGGEFEQISEPEPPQAPDVSEPEQKVSDAEEKISDAEQKLSDAAKKLSDAAEKPIESSAEKFFSDPPTPVETPQTPIEDILPTVEQPTDPVEPTDLLTPEDEESELAEEGKKSKKKVKKPKKQKARFVKLAIDDTYTYYLDKQSISWKKMPYSSTEYMADVWIRMIENDDEDEDFESGEFQFLKEKNQKFDPVDEEVLKHKRYFMEHYYLRPKTEQIQFLSELEVVGHPQNTISERKYDYQNWESLIPGSIESVIYSSVIKIIGTGKSSEKGHMSGADKLEEYLRISIR